MTHSVLPFPSKIAAPLSPSAFQDSLNINDDDDDAQKALINAFIDLSEAGLHKLWYPGIRDMSTWSKFGAHGEHGDVFLFSNLGAL